RQGRPRGHRGLVCRGTCWHGGGRRRAGLPGARQSAGVAQSAALLSALLMERLLKGGEVFKVSTMRCTHNPIVFLSRRSRMKRVVAVALMLAMLGWAVPARAVIGTIDEVPAGTLLLPYFEVDLNNPNGLTTLLSVNNASATAILAHVILWSD